MSKNFEAEYKLHIEKELPDLWTRIESALPEKNVVDDTAMTSTNDIVNTAEHSTDNNGIAGNLFTEETTEKSNVIKASHRFRKELFIRYSGLLAAAICLMVLVPAFLIMRNHKSTIMNSATSYKADSYAEAASTSEAPAEKEAIAEDSMYEEAAEEESMVMYDADIDDDFMMEESIVESSRKEHAKAENSAANNTATSDAITDSAVIAEDAAETPYSETPVPVYDADDAKLEESTIVYDSIGSVEILTLDATNILLSNVQIEITEITVEDDIPVLHGTLISEGLDMYFANQSFIADGSYSSTDVLTYKPGLATVDLLVATDPTNSDTDNNTYYIFEIY